MQLSQTLASPLHQWTPSRLSGDLKGRLKVVRGHEGRQSALDQILFVVVAVDACSDQREPQEILALQLIDDGGGFVEHAANLVPRAAALKNHQAHHPFLAIRELLVRLDRRHRTTYVSAGGGIVSHSDRSHHPLGRDLIFVADATQANVASRVKKLHVRVACRKELADIEQNVPARRLRPLLRQKHREVEVRRPDVLR